MRFEIQDEVCGYLAWAMECSLPATKRGVVFSFAIRSEVGNLRNGEIGSLATTGGVCGGCLKGDEDGAWS